MNLAKQLARKVSYNFQTFLKCLLHKLQNLDLNFTFYSRKFCTMFSELSHLCQTAAAATVKMRLKETLIKKKTMRFRCSVAVCAP